jgi:hypothetical protein
MALVRATPVPQQDNGKPESIAIRAIDVQDVFRTIRNTPECLDGSIHVRSLPVLSGYSD